ncbi:transposase [Nocardia sp. NPDC050193]
MQPRYNFRVYLTDAELSKALTAAKKDPDRAWLGKVSSVVPHQALADLNIAYRNFFASITGTRKGTRIGSPRFRSRRDHRQAIRFTKNARFQIAAGRKLRLPKTGDVKVVWSRKLPSEPSSVTIIKDAAGRYFASFVVQVEETPLPETNSEVGIDLGLSMFAVLSNGKIIAAPKFLRHVEGSARTRLAKSVHDAGWGKFTRMPEEKATRYGRHFAEVDRWFPSTRMCSMCRTIGNKKPLHIREWTCTCGTTHDRDPNAAKNILAAGRAERLNACGGAVSPAA